MDIFDMNGDGIIDSVTGDENGNGVDDAMYLDQNGDGRIDLILYDTDENGIADERLADFDENLSFETQPIGLGSSQEVFDSEQGIFYPAAFDPSSDTGHVAGNPEEAMEHWHQQTHPDTCAVVSQEYVLEELTDQEFDENELRRLAMDEGWYTPGEGTALENTGNLLEYYGLEVERHEGSSMNELEWALENDHKVIVGLSSEGIWVPGQAELDRAVRDLQGLPGTSANHAVEVIGIDRSNPSEPMVILNDPGHPGGEGALIPLADFESAWQGSNRFIVIASSDQSAGEPQAGGEISFSGYYNADGTYHWSSDNTDTDKDGNVVRRY